MNASPTDQSRFFDWKMLVVLWAALVVGGCVPVPSEQGDVVRMDLSDLTSALRLYSIKSGRYPTTEQGLAALAERPSLEPIPEHWARQVINSDVLLDPWGNEYVYSLTDEQGFRLHSVGPDRFDGTEDDISTIFEPVGK